jgi:predicted dehydrogenase
VDAADRAGRTLMVSQNYRFYPAPRTAARLVAERALGTPGSVSVDFRRWANDAEYEMNRHYRFPHPLLYDMSIHHYDLMRMVMGQEAVQVYAQDTSPAWSKFDEESEATLIITFANGQIVSYRGSWVSSGDPTHWAGEWRMEFSEGELAWTSRAGMEHGAGGDVVTARHRGSKPVKVPLDQLPLLGRSMALRHLVECIERGEEPECSGRRNLGTVAIMEAAVRSAETGRAEPVQPMGD